MNEGLNDNTGAAKAAGFLLAMRGWSRGCAALARREFARSLGRRRLTGADLGSFALACAEARNTAGIVAGVAALLLAARAPEARADLLRGNSYAAPGANGAQQNAALVAAQQQQAAQAQRARDSLSRTTQAIAAMRQAQTAARAAALASASGVVNGLGAGGLNVAAGVSSDASLWQNANLPVQSVSGNRTQVTVVQTGAKAILTWDKFDVGALTDLYFNQTAGGANASQWIALNRVTDTSANPSQILGTIKAEGQVYIVNPNGVIFGGSSQVDVHTLVASGLDFKGATVADRNAAFLQGIAFDDNRANYTLGVDAGSGRPVGDVTVKAGATIVTDETGAIYLFGKNVTNAGTLTAPGGQVGIAAGERVWVSKNWLSHTENDDQPQLHTDPSLRGLRLSVQSGGEAVNSGIIETDRGNITVTGKNVTNAGALVATTSPTANGSVTLLAGDGAAPDALFWMWATDFGKLLLQPGGVVSIAPDAGDATGFASQYLPSQLNFYAHDITFATGSTVYAPGGTAYVVAKTQSATANVTDDTSFIDVRDGALISLAGLSEVPVAMETNTVSAELRLDELKDAPIQRDGPLRGVKVSVDLRRGTTFADLSGYYGLIELTAAQSMTSGGTLKLDGGAIVTRAGSVVDLSGGSLRYADGYVSTTRLLGADGRIYDISTASPDIVYKGVYDTYSRFEAGYVQGGSAGKLIIGPQGAYTAANGVTANVVENLNTYGSGARPYLTSFEGDLLAGTVAGQYQRETASTAITPQNAWLQLPKAASLSVGYTDSTGLLIYGPNITIGGATSLPSGYAPGDIVAPYADFTLSLPASFFDGKTFGNLSLISGIGGGDLTVYAGAVVNLGVAGSLSFRGAHADIEGSIVSPGGSVSLFTDWAKGYYLNGSAPVAWSATDPLVRPSVTLGASGSVDVSGTWVNDLRSTGSNAPVAVDGGSVSLTTTGDLRLASGSSINVDGGGRLTAGNVLVSGNGGSITLKNNADSATGGGFTNLPAVSDGVFDIGSASLSGYALGAGGSLTLGSSRTILISRSAPADTGVTVDDTLGLSAGYFSLGGFSTYSVQSARDLTVASGTTLTSIASGYVADAPLWSLGTGGKISSVLTPLVKTVDFRTPAKLTLTAGSGTSAGRLTLAQGATISLDPQSSVSLVSLGAMYVDGTISTPGGSISLNASDLNPDNGLRLGGDARLLARGFVKTTPGPISVRSVESGGSVTLGIGASHGNTSYVLIDPSSVIDVSGIRGVADLKTGTANLLGARNVYTASSVNGDAGVVTISGFNGGSVSGSILASAGGVGGNPGTLSVSAGDIVSRPATIIVSNGSFITVDATTSFAGMTATLRVDARTLSSGDTGSLTLEGSKAIAFDGTTTLAYSRSLTLLTPVIGLAPGSAQDGAVTLSAPYVSFGAPAGQGATLLPSNPGLAPTLGGTLTVRAGLIDFEQVLDLGNASLGGFAVSRFVSSGDIRLTPGPITNARLYSAGDLVLESAQTYVTTGDSASTPHPFLIRSDSSVVFAGNGAATQAPYSFGGILNVRAPSITQGGVLRAPLGTINLEATGTLTLTAGSLTSVSLEGLTVPYGSVSGGFFSGDASQLSVGGAVPVAAVKLAGKDVDVRSGAVVDVSGGGAVSAYEFVPGNGGSSDILNVAGTFAVLPGYKTSAAPVTPDNLGTNSSAQTAYGSTQGLNDASLKVGDTVWLSGVKGLADGYYTLLPAHYALLTGGVAIRNIDSGYAGTLAATTLPDGSQVVSGYRSVAGTGIADMSKSRYLAMSGDVIRSYSQYNDYDLATSVGSLAAGAGVTGPRTPVDAGTLTLAATSSLVLDGTGRFSAAAGGLLGNVDIAALKIALVGPGGSAPDASYLTLDAGQFSRFGIGSLMLGATRTQTAAGVVVNVTATDILIANDASSPLVIPEFLAAATNTVTIAAGSVIRAEGVVSGNTAPLLVNGDGAMVRVSTGDRVVTSRTNAPGATGDLVIGADVTLTASGSVALDGARSVVTGANLALGTPNLDISGAKVSLGDAPSGTSGLILDSDTIGTLGNSRNLLVRSYGTIDFYGSVSLGGTGADGLPTIASLTLDSAGINGYGAAGDVVKLSAKQLVISNEAGAAPGSAATGSGTLALTASTLSFGPGASTIGGFSLIRADTGILTVSGTGSLRTASDIDAAASVVTAQKGSDYAIVSTGSVSVGTHVPGAPVAVPAGGRLAITGARLDIGTDFELPAGIIELTATNGPLTLSSGARLAARGVATTFYDVATAAPGGVVRLAATGDIRTLSGSSIDVSGTGATDAGSVSFTASGDANLAGSLAGKGGSFSLDAGTNSSGFTALGETLEAAGFTGSRTVRLRSSALTLEAGKTLTASSVSLVSDTSAVTVAGNIRSTGAVAIEGGTDATLASGGSVTASGDITFTSGTGVVTLAGGGTVTTPGALVLEAARNGGDVRVAAIGANVSAGSAQVRGRADYDRSSSGTLGSADTAIMLADAASWMTNAPAIATRLGLSGVEITPAIRVTSSGNLTVTDTVDLHDARYGASAGSFEINAGGALTINASIGDGFSDTTTAGTLLAGNSWNISLASGGDLTLAAGRLVRTGTGDIAVSAGRDLILTDTKSVIYTAGRKVADETGFVAGTRKGDYAVDGGDVSVSAGRDILAPVTKDFVTGWLYRYGSSDTTAGSDLASIAVATQTSWSVVYANFEQGLGTLGGGNMTVSAGRDIRDLAVALPTTAQMTSPSGTSSASATLVVRGGGDLTMTAGRNIYGGMTMLGRGDATLVAGGGLLSDTQSLQRITLNVPSNDINNYVSRDLHALFALMDASLTIRTRGDAQIEGVVDPMLIPEVRDNLGLGAARNTFFFSYTSRTALDVASSAGNVTYFDNPWAGADLAKDNTARPINLLMSVPENSSAGDIYVSRDLLYVPGTVSFVSAQGDVSLTQYFRDAQANQAFRLAPDADGNLRLLAAGTVSGETPVIMMDTAAQYVRGALAPFSNARSSDMLLGVSDTLSAATNYGRGFTPLHADDDSQVLIYTLNGSVSGDAPISGSQFAVYAPKAVSIRSGKDIVNVSLNAQNNDSADLTVVSAARDIVNLDVSVLGSGELLVEAGRDVTLKTPGSAGIATTGNVGTSIGTFGGPALFSGTTLTNLALPNTGASITVTAGAGDVATEAFAAAYLDPLNAAGVVRTYLPELRAYMAGLGYASSSDDTALLAAFEGLSSDSKKPFVYDVYFSELRAAGIDATDAASPRYRSYKRGFDAIAKLFPGTGSAGNINFFGKPVVTESGGDIRVIAPRGSVTIDEITNPVSGTGVVTRNGGAVSIMTKDDIALGNSRVFTLQGGNLLMWTSEGDITAGAGSKTNAVPPKLVYVVDNDGNALLNTAGLSTGSGIGVLDAGTGTVKSRLDLIAPVGTVDAGDAGIRSAGDLNIAALAVIGANNISVAGSSTGVPSVAAPNIGAITAANTTSAASNSGANAISDQQRKDAAKATTDAASVFTIEVLGYGGGSDDPEKRDRVGATPPTTDTRGRAS